MFTFCPEISTRIGNLTPQHLLQFLHYLRRDFEAAQSRRVIMNLSGQDDLVRLMFGNQPTQLFLDGLWIADSADAQRLVYRLAHGDADLAIQIARRTGQFAGMPVRSRAKANCMVVRR